MLLKLFIDERLRIDISTVKESVQSAEVNTVKWYPGAAQLANCMTKRDASGAQLLNVLHLDGCDIDGLSIE